MTMPSPPPDTRAPGQSGHIADHNTISDALTALENSVGTLLLSQANPPLVPTPVKTAAYTASAYDFVPCDVSTGGFTVKLPQAPPDKTQVGVKVVTAGASQATLTVQTQGSDVFNRAGGPTAATLTVLGRAATYQYSAALLVWYTVSDDMPESAVMPVAAASQALSSGSTISPPYALTTGVQPLTTSGAVTGVIMAAGSYTGQRVTLLNNSGNSVTFAASGTSRVADGASDVIAANTAATYTWSGSLWFRG